jgi:hypothetical protein
MQANGHYNQPDYKWYVVSARGIEAGNEYREDALDVVKEMKETGFVAKVMAKRSLGVDPNDDAAWATGSYADNATWSHSYVSALPDSAFLLVRPDGTRKFPYRNKAGHVDKHHLANALARLAQEHTDVTAAERKRLTDKAHAIYEHEFGYAANGDNMESTGRLRNNASPPPPPPRPHHADTQRRMRRLVDEEERPFEPERDYGRETRERHFAVNNHRWHEPEQIREWLDVPADTAETLSDMEAYALDADSLNEAWNRIAHTLTLASKAKSGSGVKELYDSMGSLALFADTGGENEPTLVFNLKDERWELTTVADWSEWFKSAHGEADDPPQIMSLR